ncbi:MAG: DUF1566 domain-containing protein [Bacteroidetes bacterium]|nr:DUF1566 domain-containing protein [Bacteroidota bacterium]
METKRTFQLTKSIVYAIIIVKFQLSVVNCFAQGGAAINTTGAAADNSAMLDVNSTSQGMLIPRLTTAQRNTIATPVPESLLIFNNDTKCFEFYTNGNWITLSCGCYPPSAAGNISGTATVCQGTNNVVYSVAPIANATGYTWSLPTGASIATGANTNSVTVNYAANATSGNITVYGTSNGCGNGTVSQNYAITVNANPTATASNNSPVCEGATLNLTGGPNGMSSYSWSGPSYTNSTQSPTVSTNAAPTMAGTYTVTVTDGNGCEGTASTTATIVATPTLAATTAASSISCGATSGGNVLTDGGVAITARGVCWSTSQNPVLATNNFTSNGTGTGSYTSSITGLTAGTTYYVRAYASNSCYTAYGDQISFTTLIVIGCTYQGGIIAYVDGTGLHGIIAAPNEQSTGTVIWGSGSITTNATGSAVGTGQANTTKIVTVLGANSLAYIADTLTLNGYTDWFMPSNNELGLLYNNLYLHNPSWGNFSPAWYWSSTESGSANAYGWRFSDGANWVKSKPQAYYLRAVRVF